MKLLWKYSRLFIALALIAAVALAGMSCGANESGTDGRSVQGETSSVGENGTAGVDPGGAPGETPGETPGAEGKYTFTVEIVNDRGERREVTLSTDCENLGDALLESGFVEGEESPYGLYITNVDGIRAVYEEDGAFWGLYENGEMLMSGASDTPLKDGARYGLVYTKG